MEHKQLIAEMKGATNQKLQFGAWLKMVRRLGKESQKDLARRLGVHSTYISKIENGTAETMPSYDLLCKLADALNIEHYEVLDAAGWYDETLIRYNVSANPELAKELRKLYKPSEVTA